MQDRRSDTFCHWAVVSKKSSACEGPAPQGFLDKVLWPEFQEINAAFAEHLAQVTDKVRDEFYGETGDANEVPEPVKIGR